MRDKCRTERGARAFALTLAALGATLAWTVTSCGPSDPAAAAVTSAAAPQEGKPDFTPELLGQGKKLYNDYCSTCHGAGGKGDGEAAYLLLPKPRDFSEGKFNRRSTPPQNLPSETDLFSAISDGMEGSAMPPWKDFFDENERWALVHFLQQELIAFYDEDSAKTVSLYELDPPKDPIAVPAKLPSTPETIATGRGIYNSVAECWTCHGRTGHGDGPKAGEIVNARGERIYPLDLAKGLYKLSSTDEDLFRRIKDGITIAPMYSMSGTLTDDEIWSVVHFVKSLAVGTEEERQRNRQYRRKLRAGRGALPASPDDAAWASVRSQYVPLMPLWQKPGGRVEGVFVKAVHDGKSIAIRLSWVDETEDGWVVRHQSYRDGAAIQFSSEPRPPLFAMGKKDHPVNIWHWKADWELDQTGHRDMSAQYPDMAVDDYPLLAGGPDGRHGKEKEPTSKHDPTYLSGWGAENPLSDPNKKGTVENLEAAGVGTLTSQAASRQTVRGAGKWVKGTWRVAFTRELPANAAGDVPLTAGSSVHVAFAVWDGSRGERDGQKQISIWHELVIE